MGFRRLSYARELSHARSYKVSGAYTSPRSDKVDINPDPYNYEILRLEKIGDCYVVKVKYMDCTNYEGNKILLLRNDPTRVKSLDPHFTNNHMLNCGLIARFEPTGFGWNLACECAKLI